MARIILWAEGASAFEQLIESGAIPWSIIRSTQFIEGMQKNAGWDKQQAEDHFFHFAPLFEIGSAVDFTISETKRLRLRYPAVQVAPSPVAWLVETRATAGFTVATASGSPNVSPERVRELGKRARLSGLVPLVGVTSGLAPGVLIGVAVAGTTAAVGALSRTAKLAMAGTGIGLTDSLSLNVGYRGEIILDDEGTESHGGSVGLNYSF